MDFLEYKISRPVVTQDQLDNLYSRENDQPKTKKSNDVYKLYDIQKLRIYIAKIFPIFQWIKEYRISSISNDIAAGVTVAIFNIPQGMAYANLANLPEVIGLYTSFFCPLIYLFFGTSKHLSMGIVSVVALMVGSTLNKYSICHHFNLTETIKENNIDDLESIHYLTILTFTTGMILFLMAICQAHFIAAYLSDALVHGFTTAAAIHTVMSQIPKILGISVASRSGFLKLYYISVDIVRKVTKTNWPDFIISICCIIVLLLGNLLVNPKFIKQFRIPFPFELLTVIVLILLSKFFDFNYNYKVAIIANIPKGLPTIHIPKWSLFVQVLPDAMAIAIVIYAFSLSVARLIAKRNHYVVYSGQELFAYGLCNIVSSFFLCHPSAGSLTRTIINSNISGIFSSTIVLLVIVWTANLLETLPKLIWIVAFLATVCWDIIEGLAVAFTFTIITILFRLQWPKFIQLAPIKETDIYVDYKIYKLSSSKSSIVAFRYEAPLLFFNQENFKNKFYEFFDEHEKFEKSAIFYVILDASSISMIDTSGAATIFEIIQFFKEKNVDFLISCSNGEIRSVLKKQGVLLENVFFQTVHDAFLYANYQICKATECINESEISFV